MADHVHMTIAIPPKFAVSQVVGFIKGESAIWLGSLANGGVTSSAKAFGHGAISFRWSVGTRR